MNLLVNAGHKFIVKPWINEELVSLIHEVFELVQGRKLS